MRGAERQRPSILKKANIFDKSAEDKLVLECHRSLGKEAVLEMCFADYNTREDVANQEQWQLGHNERQAIKNLILRVSPGAKAIMAQHLSKRKGDLAAWSNEPIRRGRWLLGGVASNTEKGSTWDTALTMTEGKQVAFLKRVVHLFQVKNPIPELGKVVRLNDAQWKQEVHYMCVCTFLLDLAAAAEHPKTGALLFDGPDMNRFTLACLEGWSTQHCSQTLVCQFLPLALSSQQPPTPSHRYTSKQNAHQ